MQSNIRRKLPRLLALILLVTAAAAHAEDWPRWRGPHLDGISRETQWRDTFSADGPTIAWRGNVGTGYSSFAVAEGRLFTMGNTDNIDTVHCLDAATGKPIWTHSYEAPLEAKFFEGGPTSTPTVEGASVYTFSRQGDLFRFDAATGKVQWSVNVAQKAGMRIPGWGFSGSPLIQGDLVIVNAGESGVAMNKNTGEIVWKSADRDAGYSTPLPFTHHGMPALILGGAKQWTAVETATGKPLWSHRWLTRYGVNAADPILTGDGDGRVLISSGYGKGAALLQPPAAGTPGSDTPNVVWTSKELRTQLSPGVLIGGHVYAIDGDAGIEDANLRCIELATGEVKWIAEEIDFGSVIAAGSKLIVLTAEGELIIAPASPQGFTPTARAKVLDAPCWTVPVLANGRLYCRNAAGDVVCLDVMR